MEDGLGSAVESDSDSDSAFDVLFGDLSGLEVLPSVVDCLLSFGFSLVVAIGSSCCLSVEEPIHSCAQNDSLLSVLLRVPALAVAV